MVRIDYWGIRVACLQCWSKRRLDNSSSYRSWIVVWVGETMRWVMAAGETFIALCLVTTINKQSVFFIPGNCAAIALVASAAVRFRHLEKEYIDVERKEDALYTLKEAQEEEQLAFLESAAESRRSNEEADKQMERQLKLLQETAPLFSELLNLTGQNGAIERMALGMLQGGASIGEVLVTTADTEIKLEQAKLSAQLQQRQMEVQAAMSRSSPTAIAPVVADAFADSPGDKATTLKKAAAIVGIQTECLKIDKAPSYERLVFGVRTEDYNLLAKWKAAAKLALGEKHDIPLYVHGSEKVAIELPLSKSDRTFCEFPSSRQWVKGDRLIFLGQSLDGEVTVDLASEDTPQLLVVGTTGSGKTNFLRSAAYCLLMQNAKVDICGGKVSDYEDFGLRFPTISVNDMGQTDEYVSEYYAECDLRNNMTKDQLAKVPAWMLIIDEYKGTVPFDEKQRKIYDQQLCEIGRRGRGLKLHLIIGLQRGSKRTKDDPQALPPDLRDNLPCRIAFHCVDATSGRMVLHHRGEAVTSLQGRGDGIVQSGLLDTRFQAYRFEMIP